MQDRSRGFISRIAGMALLVCLLLPSPAPAGDSGGKGGVLDAMQAALEAFLPRISRLRPTRIEWPAFQFWLDNPDELEKVQEGFQRLDETVGAVPVAGTLWNISFGISEAIGLSYAKQSGIYSELG